MTICETGRTRSHELFYMKVPNVKSVIYYGKMSNRTATINVKHVFLADDKMTNISLDVHTLIAHDL